MRELRELGQRAEPALRILCLILAGVLVYELAGMAIRLNPFHGVTVPDLPTLTTATNAPTGLPAGMPPTVVVSSMKGTNGAQHLSSTNVVVAKVAGTNSVPIMSAGKGTNLMAHAEPVLTLTNAATNATATLVTNIFGASNIVVKIETKAIFTNATNISSASVSTNTGTNLLLSAAGNGTNAAATKPKHKRIQGGPMGGMAGMGFGPFGPPGGHRVELPPAVQARVDKITDSEILGPVMRPLPMALLGIAGDVAFLRTDSGQTGMEKVGDTLDDIKLLRIGVNRVLIEQNGDKKELTIFSGYGGESLLQNDSTNENKHL